MVGDRIRSPINDMTMTQQQLMAEIDKLVDAGDEKAVERFMIDHYQELPEEVQGKLLLGFYAESLQKEADEARIMELQEQGVELLDALAAMKEPGSENK